MEPKEPYRLERRSSMNGQVAGSLYTCARPGRSMGAKQAEINDTIVESWAEGIIHEIGSPTVDDNRTNDEIIIVSLLGRKPNGLSEFSYYSFCGGFDSPEQRAGHPTWQQWLSGRYGSKFRVYEFPTEDLKPVSEDMKRRAIDAVLGFMRSGRTIILVDSGGFSRTGNLASAIMREMGDKR